VAEPVLGIRTPDDDTSEDYVGPPLLEEVAGRNEERFRARRQILAFNEYFELVTQNPRRHVRTVPLYLRDMLEHYGTEEVRTQRGMVRRFKMFDAPFNGGTTRVLGQEGLQNEFYKRVVAFCEKGAIDKLLLLHGPNGTAKSTFVECVVAGLEDYSQQDEGVLYRFNWIFSERADRESLGFHHKPLRRADGSLAYLEPDQISFKLGCELKDHPLLLIPREERREILGRALEDAGLEPRVPRWLEKGDLCPKCMAIYSALGNAYQGNWKRILEHVQIERLYMSKRYRRGAVVIQPQRNVDAASRPLNLEKSYRLPSILNQSSLSELSGDLIDANRGVVEYSDFFKRPLELSKYLLTTSEKGTISLPDAIAYLDCLFTATCNEKNLTLFKRNPDFPSFKGRFELLRAPYLLCWSTEEELYKRDIQTVAQKKHVAPHTTRVIALWGVLTRLRRPRSQNYKGELANLVTRVRPLDKARLYDSGRAPEEWSNLERRELQNNLEAVAAEYDHAEEEFEGIPDAAYEGRRGASPREIFNMLHEAAQDVSFSCLSPLAVLRVVRRVATDRSLYEFLRLEAEAGYGDIERLTDDVESEYRRLVRDEVHRALALVEESAYAHQFEDYFHHVKAFDSGEKVMNRLTRKLEPASEELMKRVEGMVGLGGEEPGDYRKNLIMRIAAWSIDNPGKPVAYKEIFGDIFQALRQHYHGEREAAIDKMQDQILRYGTEDWVTVDEADQQRVVDAFERLKTDYGYCDACAKEAISYVLRHKGEA
jgi:predicted Ser/Thr protein kinase